MDYTVTHLSIVVIPPLQESVVVDQSLNILLAILPVLIMHIPLISVVPLTLKDPVMGVFITKSTKIVISDRLLRRKTEQQLGVPVRRKGMRCDTESAVTVDQVTVEALSGLSLI